MKPQAYQKPTIYNSDGTKAQIGTYDIRTDPLTNSKADGILDYINNNLEALKIDLSIYAKKTDLSAYQTKLTFDTTPTANSTNPVTSGGIKTALDTKLNKTDAANTYLDKLSKTEQVVTAPIKGTLNGNASSATKLATARTINVTDADGTNTGTGASFNGTNNATIKLPNTIRLYDLTLPNIDGEIRPTGGDGQKSFAILADTNNPFNYSRIFLSSKTNGSGNGYIYIISDNGEDSSQLLLTPTGASYDKTLKTTIDGNASSATKATQDSNGNQINTTYLDKLTTTVQKVTAPIQHAGTPSSNDELVNKSYVDSTVKTAVDNVNTAISNYVNSNIFRVSMPAGDTITDKLNNASMGITYWPDYNSASYSPTGANDSWTFKIVKFGQGPIRYWICEAQNAGTKTIYRFIDGKWYQVGLTALS